eukprot:TRINITY_DN996_c0_g1_i7.p2 TRINITY_DN996_c0_g1~~TRINITY_DN996_c0_g1_i7.p2  ORF type:complete len:177 (-),score=53.23 TRINITY_DN996_c0_g1_i7:134-664(-)
MVAAAAEIAQEFTAAAAITAATLLPLPTPSQSPPVTASALPLLEVAEQPQQHSAANPLMANLPDPPTYTVAAQHVTVPIGGAPFAATRRPLQASPLLLLDAEDEDKYQKRTCLQLLRFLGLVPSPGDRQRGDGGSWCARVAFLVVALVCVVVVVAASRTIRNNRMFPTVDDAPHLQ